jgi:hypothetical protein
MLGAVGIAVGIIGMEQPKVTHTLSMLQPLSEPCRETA